MYKKIYRTRISLFLILIIITTQFFSPALKLPAYASGAARIHYLTLPGSTEAILLECNGRFGMVDSGEDNDYPDGSDPAYPLRPGIVKGNGYEDMVIDYLRSVGVTQDNFEFYIGTHPHSDHIGSADEIIRSFHPKRVYIQEYKDSYISNEANLWDNLYVYDQMLTAADEVNATIIQDFAPGAPCIRKKYLLKVLLYGMTRTTQTTYALRKSPSLSLILPPTTNRPFSSHLMRKETGHISLTTCKNMMTTRFLSYMRSCFLISKGMKSQNLTVDTIFSVSILRPHRKSLKNRRFQMRKILKNQRIRRIRHSRKKRSPWKNRVIRRIRRFWKKQKAWSSRIIRSSQHFQKKRKPQRKRHSRKKQKILIHLRFQKPRAVMYFFRGRSF